MTIDKGPAGVGGEVSAVLWSGRIRGALGVPVDVEILDGEHPSLVAVVGAERVSVSPSLVPGEAWLSVVASLARRARRGVAGYVGATELARICEVDLKSIHNWCERAPRDGGEPLPHFRTPGGHFRFKLAEVVPWLRARGFDVPAAIEVRA